MANLVWICKQKSGPIVLYLEIFNFKTFRAEILQIFELLIWEIDDFINSFWLYLTFSLTIDTFRSTGWNQIDSGLRSSRIPYCRKSSHIPKRWRIIRLVLTCWCPTLCQRVSFWPGGWFSFDNLLVSLSW